MKVDSGYGDIKVGSLLTDPQVESKAFQEWYLLEKKNYSVETKPSSVSSHYRQIAEAASDNSCDHSL